MRTLWTDTAIRVQIYFMRLLPDDEWTSVVPLTYACLSVALETLGTQFLQRYDV